MKIRIKSIIGLSLLNVSLLLSQEVPDPALTGNDVKVEDLEFFTSLADHLDFDPYGDQTPGNICNTAGEYAATIYLNPFYLNRLEEGVQLYTDKGTPLGVTEIGSLPLDHRLKKVVPNGVKLVRFVSGGNDPSEIWEVDTVSGKLLKRANRDCK